MTQTIVKVEAGKRYMRRDGQTTGEMVDRNRKDGLRFKDPDTNTLYYDNGLVSPVELSEGTNDADLMAEVKRKSNHSNYKHLYAQAVAEDNEAAADHSLDGLAYRVHYPDLFRDDKQADTGWERWSRAGVDGNMWELPPVEVQRAAARILLQVEAHYVASEIARGVTVERLNDQAVVMAYLHGVIEQDY